MAIKESKSVLNIKKAIKANGGYIEKIGGGGFQAEGIPDLIACIDGRFYGIEGKVGKNEPSPIQIIKLRNIVKAGGRGIFVWDGCELSEHQKAKMMAETAHGIEVYFTSQQMLENILNKNT